jgi:hypothetical protein
MADDLDDFLKQAAARRQQRQQKKENRAPLPTPPISPAASAPVRTLEPERPSFANSLPTAEKPRFEPQIGSLEPTVASTIGSTSNTPLASSSLSDGSTLGEGYQREISKIRSSEQQNKKKNKQGHQSLSQSQAVEVDARETQQPAGVTEKRSLAQQLRDPNSLRMAILAQEILKRPWE